MKQTWGIWCLKHVAPNEQARGSQGEDVRLWWHGYKAMWVLPSESDQYRFTDRDLALSDLYKLRSDFKRLRPIQLSYPKMKTFSVITNAHAVQRAIADERRDIQSYINLRVNTAPQAERDALIKLQDWLDNRDKQEALDE